jgi:hypothetical protein
MECVNKSYRDARSPSGNSTTAKRSTTGNRSCTIEDVMSTCASQHLAVMSTCGRKRAAGTVSVQGICVLSKVFFIQSYGIHDIMQK